MKSESNASYYQPSAPTSSTAEQLATQPLTCGTADPTHTPLTATQKYINTTSGQEWTWLGGAWK